MDITITATPGKKKGIAIDCGSCDRYPEDHNPPVSVSQQNIASAAAAKVSIIHTWSCRPITKPRNLKLFGLCKVSTCHFPFGWGHELG
jgi:hypothetical protein